MKLLRRLSGSDPPTPSREKLRGDKTSHKGSTVLRGTSGSTASSSAATRRPGPQRQKARHRVQMTSRASAPPG
eukprot:7146534-Pyramimonas_sp.AAC.1